MPSEISASVFFSHNSRDKDLLKPLASRLIDEYDVRCWLDQWDLPAGREWEREIENALRLCGAGAVFLGGSGWGRHHLREARVIIDRASTHADFNAIPVLLPDATEEAMNEVGDFFRSRHRVDFRGGISSEEAFQVLRAAVGGQAQGPPVMTPSTVRRDAQRWSTRPTRDKSMLYRGLELQQAEKVAQEQPESLDPLAIRFLAASAAEEQRAAKAERKRSRIVGAVQTALSLALAIALFFALFSKWIADEEKYVSQINSDIAVKQSIKASKAREEAERQRKKAVENLELARSRQREAERQTRRALAFNLAEQGQDLIEQKPLLATRLMLEALRYAGTDDSELAQRAATSLKAMKQRARILKFESNVLQPYVIEGAPLMVVSPADRPSELRRTSDGTLVAVLSGRAVAVYPQRKISWRDKHDDRFADSVEPGMPFFLVRYADGSREFRRIADGSVIPTTGAPLWVLNPTSTHDGVFVVTFKNERDEFWWEIWRSTPLSPMLATELMPSFLEESSLFIVFDKRHGTAELRRRTDGAILQNLTFDLEHIPSITGVSRDRSLIAVSYAISPEDQIHENTIDEVRSSSSGAVLPLSGKTDVVRFDTRSNRYIVGYADRPGEIRRTDTSEVRQLPGRVTDAWFLEHFLVLAYETSGEIRSTDGSRVVLALHTRPTGSLHVKDSDSVIIQHIDSKRANYEVFVPAAATLIPTPDLKTDDIKFLISPRDNRAWRLDTGHPIDLPPEQRGCAWVGETPYILNNDFADPSLYRIDNGKTILLTKPGYAFSVTQHLLSKNGSTLLFGNLLIDTHSDRVVPLPANSKPESVFVDESRAVVIQYDDHNGELRRVNGELIAELSGVIASQGIVPNKADTVFFVRYNENILGELRDSHDGHIITMAKNLWFGDGNDWMLVVHPQHFEVWKDGKVPRPVVSLDREPGLLSILPGGRHAIVWYDKGGDTSLLDLQWAEQPTTSATLERDVCRVLETPLFTQQGSLSRYLLGQPALACRKRAKVQHPPPSHVSAINTSD